MEKETARDEGAQLCDKTLITPRWPSSTVFFLEHTVWISLQSEPANQPKTTNCQFKSIQSPSLLILFVSYCLDFDMIPT